MERGYIKLWRQLKEKSWYHNQKWVSAWIDMLLTANHKTKEIIVDNNPYIVKKGSFITSQRKLAEKWDWGLARVNFFLSFLQKTERSIELKTEHNFSHITIINWDKYQGDNKKVEHKTEHKTEQERNKSGTRTETNNNDNNDKNDKKSIILHSGETPQGQEINDLISLFKELNPSYKRLYPNKTQRSALERMLKEHGKEKIEQAIALCIKVASRKFAPVITTPCALEEKLGQLVAYVKKEMVKSPTITKI